MTMKLGIMLRKLGSIIEPTTMANSGFLYGSWDPARAAEITIGTGDAVHEVPRRNHRRRDAALGVDGDEPSLEELQVAGDRQRNGDENQRPQPRQRDVAELLPSAGAVQPRRFVQ